MRSIIAAAGLVVLLLVIGCNIAPHRRDGGGDGIAVNTTTPTATNLVEYLNNNAKGIEPGQAISCTNVTIDVNADGQKIGVGGKMICQTPRNFLLSGVVLGSPAVDIGSNDKEFWYWIRENKPPYLFHCSYDDLARGTNIPFPFQPDMVVNALGLAHYDPVKQYDIKVVDDKRGHKAIEMTEQARSPRNEPIQRVTVFAFHQAQPPQPQVIAHVLKNAQGKVICIANIRSVQRLGPKDAIIPREIVFDWPEMKLQMKMKLENPRLVAMPETRAAETFTRKNLSYQSFDLFTQTLDGAGLQRTGAVSPIYRR